MASVYQEYSRDRVGWFFGLSGWQLATVVGAGAPALWAFHQEQWGLLGLLLAGWVLVVLLVVVPIRGRSATGWLAAAVAFAVGTLVRWTRWRSHAATGTVEDLDHPDLPGVLAGIRVHDGPPQGPSNTRVAIIQDHTHRVWAATAAITHPGLAVTDSLGRDSQGRGLTALLNAAARTELISEIQFLVRSVPDDGAERDEWLAGHQPDTAPALSRRINHDLAASLSRASVRTEAFVTIVMHETRLARESKEFGRGIDARARAMGMLMAEVEGHLRTGMRISAVSWLTSPELAVAVRTGFAPGDRAGIIAALAARERGETVNADVPWAQSGPAGAETAVRHYSHDAWHSITASLVLPARGAVIGALAPVVVPTEPGERRSLTVVYPIVAQPVADRQAQSAETAADMAEALRNRAGNPDPSPGPHRCRPHPRTGRQARLRTRTPPTVCGRLRNRPRHRTDRRARPSARRLHPARRFRAAAARPRPGRRLRRRHPPTRPRSRTRPGHHMNREPPPGRRAGRGLDALLADFGHDLPTLPQPVTARREVRLFQQVPRRGERRPNRGWSPARAPVAQWRMTGDQAPVLWPFVTAPGLPPRGAQMGIDYFSRASFYADPNGWVLNPDIPVSNPNIFTFGKPGMGKSATVKAFLGRMFGFGYRALILGDPKDEYEPLCRAHGVEPIAIGQGLFARINPLAFGPLGQGWTDLDRVEARRRAGIVFARWLTLIRGLVGSQKIGTHPVPFGPSEETAVDVALKLLTGFGDGATTLVETTIPQLWRLLDEPPNGLVESCRYGSTRQFLDETRLLRDALGQLVNGTLKGLFDDHTTIQLDWTAPIQSLSLSRLEGLGDDAVGMALLCLNSWGRAMRETAAPGDQRIVVRDESWKQLRLGVEAVKSFDADLRLSRRDGDIQFAVAHKPSDLASVGDAGSQATAIARDLLHLADTKILHGQDQKIADELETLLGLSPLATNLVTDWCRQAPGRALWVVGEHLFKVQTILHPAERPFTWTNAQIEIAGSLPLPPQV